MKKRGSVPVSIPVSPPGPAPGVAEVLAAATAALQAATAALSGSPPPSPLAWPANAGKLLEHGAPGRLAFPVASLRVLADAFLEAKGRAGRSERYLRLLRWQFAALCERLGAVPAAEVTAEHVEGVISRAPVSAVTRRGWLLTLGTLFRWAQRRGYVAGNPCLSVDAPTVPPGAPVVHPPGLVREVLTIAFKTDRDLARALALRYFAGLRRSEVERIGEGDIGQEFVTVPARAAKTRARRVVRIQPALAAFLELGGELPLLNPNDRWSLLSKRLPASARGHNGPRHSFCSYHLAAFQSASLTALEAGHTEAVLFRQYRELVSEADAWAFWGLRPG